MDLTSCPECGTIAEVQWRDVLESTDGPIEPAKIRCLNRHWFLLPVASLARSTVTAHSPRTGASSAHARHD